MDSGDVERLTVALSDFEQRTGIEVAVVTLPSVPDGDVDQAATDLFKEWGIGKRGQDNGVLIFCSVGDRRIRIEVGYGLEHVLTDAKSGRLIDEVILPRFRAGDLSGGLTAGGLQLIELLRAPPAVNQPAPISSPSAPSSRPIPYEWLAVLLFLGIWWFVLREIWRTMGGGVSDYWYGGWSGGDFGGSFGGGSGGGFGGFGGGSSGGGGASRGW